jgi:hypothetical protein
LARGQQPQTRTAGAPKSSAATPNKGPTQTSKTATLPRTPRTSAVTLTLSEGPKVSYAEVITTARQNIPLAEISFESVDMKRAMTGAIITKVPANKDGEKASLLVTPLAKVLDPTTVGVAAPVRMAELRVVGIDISVKKKELWQALALAAGCGGAEVQFGEIGVSRGGLESVCIKCPVAGARTLVQAGKVALSRFTARVIPIPQSVSSAWCWETYEQLACPLWIEDTKADMVPEAVLHLHPSAPCASLSGHPPTTEWAERHAPPLP